jgi:glycosyltransferase involved in cell wall biosynthesis
MADIVAAPTRELANELRSYGLRNVVRLPNGIDFKKLGCSRKEIAAFRNAHGIPPRSKVVLYLGRISFEKRLDILLEAFRMIGKKDRVLVIAGDGPYLNDFKKFARALGIRNAIFTGFIRRPGPAYGAADIFASASDSETFGLTFVEAMRFGLPVVGVRRLGAKEVITDGKNGILVEPGDAPALARSLERLLSDKALRGKLGEEGMETAKRYSIENSVRETLRLYRKLIKKR